MLIKHLFSELAFFVYVRFVLNLIMMGRFGYTNRKHYAK